MAGILSQALPYMALRGDCKAVVRACAASREMRELCEKGGFWYEVLQRGAFPALKRVRGRNYKYLYELLCKEGIFGLVPREITDLRWSNMRLRFPYRGLSVEVRFLSTGRRDGRSLLVVDAEGVEITVGSEVKVEFYGEKGDAHEALVRHVRRWARDPN